MLGSKAWRELGETPLRGRSVAEHIELEPKGGLVVASSEQTLGSLDALVDDQRQVGVQAAAVPADELLGLEPNLAHGLAGGYLYPQDMQVQPMLAAATLLRLARDAGADLLLGDAVAGFLRLGERVVGVRTAKRDVPAGAVVNAAGPWAGTVAALAGVYVPVAPRRGFILVTAATSRAAQGLLRRIRRRRRERLRCPAVLAGR